jgi:signal transduction histidine kinase
MASVTMPSKRSTWFLPAERIAGERLGSQVAAVASNEIVEALLRSWGGAVAILNPQRQVVALNGAWLQAMGTAVPSEALGLRPGETLRCVYAAEAPGGCGTAKACASCGGAAAIVAASARGVPEERDCSLSVKQDGEVRHLELQVRAVPFEIGGEPLTLLSFRDVSVERRRAWLERTLFHDLATLVAGLGSAAQALPDLERPEDAAAVDDVRTLAERLARELQLQRALADDPIAELQPARRPVELARVVDLVERLFRHHPAATGKSLRVSVAGPATLMTDPDLLQRVLASLVLNAFEATIPGGTVRLTVEPAGDGVALRVWNAAAIPASVLPRIFQRYFTTKPGEGRGQGTFVAKVFTERFLGGSLSVASSAEGGTAFEVRLP